MISTNNENKTACSSAWLCVDEHASFSLHVDSIECSTSSMKGNDYLCLTLELKNCTDHDRTSPCMTMFSCVLQNAIT